MPPSARPRLTRRGLLHRWAASLAVGATLAQGLRPTSAGASTLLEPAAWQRVPVAVAPPARRDHSLTFDPASRRVYLFGGSRRGTALNDLWAFDLDALTWTELAPPGPIPPPRLGHNAAFDAAHGQLVIAMGQAGGAFRNDVWAFDPAAGTWRPLGADSAPRPRPRYGAGGALDPSSGRLLITHGFTDEGRFDDTWAFDLTAETWARVETAGPVPRARCLCRAAWDAGSGRLLLFGGQSNPAPFLGDLWSLDVTPDLHSAAWTLEDPQATPGPRHLYAGDFDPASRRWYIAGGNTPTGPTADLWVHDRPSATWSPLITASDAPAARQSADLTLAGTRLILFGGRDATAEQDDTWLLPLA